MNDQPPRSLLMTGIGTRLAAALAVVALLWVAVIWALIDVS